MTLISASANGHQKVVELLLKSKSDTNFQDKFNNTALICGIYVHFNECWLLLLIKLNNYVFDDWIKKIFDSIKFR